MSRTIGSSEPLLGQDIDRSADPPSVARALERLSETQSGLCGELEENVLLRQRVIAVCAASRSLTTLLVSDPIAIEVLRNLDTRPPLPLDSDLNEDSLRKWKTHEYLRIAARDLTGLNDLPTVAGLISDLARDVLISSRQLAGAKNLLVVGMGKLGGHELNYASDIDIIFVSNNDGDHVQNEASAREVMRIAGGCFRVDTNLRPEGRSGPLTRTLSSYEAYWRQWAEPWEFQALLKARPMAGSDELSQAFLDSLNVHLWERTFSADELRSLRTMKARTEAEVSRSKSAGRDLKRGAGGIRDIEFSVQILQLVHGRHDHELRSPTTLDVLSEMASAAYIDHQDAFVLDGCYRFLRTVEHRVQLVDEQQIHAVPKDDTERDRLARVMGYRPKAGVSALKAFDAELVSRQATVRSVYERLYFRPLLEAFSGISSQLSSEAAEERLAAFGFRETDRTRQAVKELTRGLTRSSRLMDQFLPLLFGWLADSPDPDQGLLGLRKLATGTQRTTELVRSFRESPEAARRLSLILGTSSFLSQLLQHNPDLIAELAENDPMVLLPAEELLETARSVLAWREPGTRNTALKRSNERELVRIATRDLLGLVDLQTTETNLTGLAEATLHAALEATAPKIPFSIVAMGRFGGAELSYASDLDVLFVYEGTTPSDLVEAERVATSLLRFVGGDTPVERIWSLDLNLRPEGRQGPLARSLEGFATYFQRWAAVWERQAMARARPVAGNQALGEKFMALVHHHVWQLPFTEEDVREIRRIKARVERERLPTGDDPQFHLKLGRGALVDIEFCVQLLQLQHLVRSPGTMTALHMLANENKMDQADMEILSEAYLLCENTRNRLFLLRGIPDDSLPQDPQQLTTLARSLDTTPSELREHYRRVTRRARQVIEHLFYGQTQEST
ncbi:MAG: bifunctional [glutamine synthetase] adenylyltransferase/[glutamine synthetase]-adenylyl-L-tyrosine phosphorylase [Acidimicrobiales bacterium]